MQILKATIESDINYIVLSRTPMASTVGVLRCGCFVEFFWMTNITLKTVYRSKRE